MPGGPPAPPPIAAAIWVNAPTADSIVDMLNLKDITAKDPSVVNC
jgi:hypothetical protein